MATAHQASPAAKTAEPSDITAAAPKRAMSRPATTKENSGTISGPGAIARPVRSADQPQLSWAHSTTDNSMAPKDTENSKATAEAAEKLRVRNSPGSISGLWWRAQRRANSPSRTAEAAITPTVAADPQPQPPPSTSPKLSSQTPAVISSAPSASGRGEGWPGMCGSLRQPTASAAAP